MTNYIEGYLAVVFYIRVKEDPFWTELSCVSKSKDGFFVEVLKRGKKMVG